MLGLEDAFTDPAWNLEPGRIEGTDVYEALRDKIFDCPECNSPAEVAAVTVFVSDMLHDTFYIISCIGQHSVFSVEAAWFHDNITVND